MEHLGVVQVPKEVSSLNEFIIDEIYLKTEGIQMKDEKVTAKENQENQVKAVPIFDSSLCVEPLQFIVNDKESDVK